MQPITNVDNSFPYFNDYTVEDNFYQILFKPVQEIQVRELNQLQTILHEQIARCGKNIFKDGSLVKGCDHNINTTCKIITFTDTSLITNELKELINNTSVLLKSKTSGCIIQLLFIEGLECVVTEISENQVVENDIFYYYDSSTATISDEPLFIIASVYTCVWVKFNDGIIFKDGYFIRVNAQRKILARNSTFSGHVGFRVIKKIIDKTDILYTKRYIKKDGPNKLTITLRLDSIPLQTDTAFLNEFIEFLQVKDNVLNKDIRLPIFSELEKTIARRTNDQWGSYTVTPFVAKINYEEQTPDTFDVVISPGNAYIAGYNFETLTSKTIKLDRALDYATRSNFYLPITYGCTITLSSFSGTFNSNLCEEIKFYDDTVANVITAYPTITDKEVGVARVRSVQFNGTELTLYLFDFHSYPNRTFSEALSVFSTSGFDTFNGKGDLDIPFNGISNTNDSSLLFELPETCIRNLKDEDNNASSLYYIQKLFSGVQFNTHSDYDNTTVVGQITVPFTETIVQDISQCIICPLNGDDYIYPSSFESLDEDSKKVRIVLLETSTFTADVYVKVQIDISNGKSLIQESKTLTPVAFNSAVSTLIQVDYHVISITSIKKITTNEDVTHLFELINNNTIEIINKNTLNYIGTTTLTGNLTIVYSCYTSSQKGFISVDSYLTDIEFKQEKIGSNKYTLRNYIDFRSYLNDEVNYIPLPSSFFICDYSYYLGRIDLLVATSTQQFEIIKGISSSSPVPSLSYNTINNMVLYRYGIPPLSKNPKDITINFIENKRYTMKDINKLNNRLSSLEYYTQLSLLEKETNDLVILDENGDNRLKNGYMVDNFKTSNSMQYVSVDNICSIDTEKGHLLPSFDITNNTVLYNPYESTTRRTGDLISIPYEEIPFIVQSKASSTENLQPFEVFNWFGNLELFPCSDEWVDIEKAPLVNANLYGENDIWEQIGSKAFKVFNGTWERNVLGSDIGNLETINSDPQLIPISSSTELWNPSSDPGADAAIVSLYNQWVSSNFTNGFRRLISDHYEKNANGEYVFVKEGYVGIQPDGYINGKPALYLSNVPKEEFSNTVLSKRTGQASFTASKIIMSSLGEHTTDISLVHFLRAKQITFKANNLKPNVTFYLLFDKENLTSLCTPVLLVSDSDGKLSGVLSLPGGRFTTGDHTITLIDDVTGVNIQSSATAKYSGVGLKQISESTTVSTREPQITYLKTEFVVTPSPTPTPSVTPTVTPTISVTPSITPTITVTPSITPTITPTLSVSAAAGNRPPVVNAGPDQNVQLPVIVQLRGTVTDDRLPDNTLTSIWTKYSGPGTVTFEDDTNPVTKVTFSESGQYVLLLTGSDGELEAYDGMMVNVGAAGPENQPPVVNAGPDVTITLPTTSVTLQGTASDDGLPTNTLTTTWSKVSGPGTVTFGNSASLTSTATFSTIGTYVLALTASDGVLSAYDGLTVNVAPKINEALTIVVNAGPDKTTNVPYYFNVLDGYVTVNGVMWDINNTKGVTPTWSKISGPGSVTFEKQLPTTRADFSVTGQYVLKLSATDGVQTVWDGMLVNVNNVSPPTSKLAVDAGPDQTYYIDNPIIANIPLDGTVWDTLNPSPIYPITTKWEFYSITPPLPFRAGNTPHIGFNNARQIDTVAWVDDVTPAQYVITLTATDINSSAYDGMMVTILPKDAEPNPTLTVNAGSDRTFNGLPASTNLEGSVTITNLPNPPNVPNYTWTVLSSPTNPSISNNKSLTSGITFNSQGQYVLKLTATCGSLISSDTVTFTIVNQQSTPTPSQTPNPTPTPSYNPSNNPPVVYAGTDKTATLSTSGVVIVNITDSSVTDDGHVLATPTYSWTRDLYNGNPTGGYANFSNTTTVQTSITFKQAGTYVFRLTAYDGEFTIYDTAQIIIYANQSNQPPSVYAGANRTVTLDNGTVTVSLDDSSATDDGLPNNALSLTWTRDKFNGSSSGGYANFSSTTILHPTITFQLAGTYTLKLLASDGSLTAFDTVDITVDNEPQQERTLSISVSGSNASSGLSKYGTIGYGITTSLSNLPSLAGPGSTTIPIGYITSIDINGTMDAFASGNELPYMSKMTVSCSQTGYSQTQTRKLTQNLPNPVFPGISLPANINSFNINVYIEKNLWSADGQYTDPLAESFFINESDYPEGLFVSSIDVFFKTKSSTSTVTLELRPSVNGYPSSKEIIPLSQVTLYPINVVISNDASLSTNFKFNAPIYLIPGEYHFVLRSNDTDYTIWVAKLGEFEIVNPEKRITSNPYSGVLLKSSNNSTWIPDSNTDLKFTLNRCSFIPNTSFKCSFENSPYFSNAVEKTNDVFNSLRQNALIIKPDNTFIEDGVVTLLDSNLETVSGKAFTLNNTVELNDEYTIEDQSVLPTKSSISNTALLYTEETDINLTSNTYMLQSSVVNLENYYSPSIITTFNLRTTKENVSPIIDLQRLSYIYVHNLINTYDLIEDEETVSGGPASCRYIVKPIKLVSDTPANSLHVSLAAIIPQICSIKLYYKIWSSTQDASSSIDEKQWNYIGTNNITSLEFTDFEFIVEPDEIVYDNINVDGFDWFTIKVVLESSNSGTIPKIKDFRTIALTT